MLHQFTVVRRHPEIPADEFASRWRDLGDEIAAAVPADLAPRRWLQSVPLGTRNGWCDGIGQSTFAGQAEREQFFGWLAGDPERIRASQALVGSSDVVLATHRVVRGGDELARGEVGGDGSLVLLGFLRRRKDISRRAFADYWWDKHRPLADSLTRPELSPVAYVHNYATEDSPADWDGVGELFESSFDIAKERGAWFDSPEAAPLLEDEARFFQRDARVIVPVRRHVVIDTTGNGATA